MPAPNPILRALQEVVNALMAPHEDHCGDACDGERGRHDCCWQCAALNSMEDTIWEFETANDHFKILVPAWMRRSLMKKAETRAARLEAAAWCTCGSSAYECAHCRERRCMECNRLSRSESIKTAVRWCPTHREAGRNGHL